MKIDKIVRKDDKNVLVHFDSDEILILSVDVFIKSGLKIYDYISKDRFNSLIKENLLFHIKQRAFRYLGRRLHSTAELRTKLLQKGYEKNLIEAVLDDLKLKKYLDDAAFAKMFVYEKVKLKLWGERKLKNELVKKGINSKIISDIFRSNISDIEIYNNAKLLAEKKYGLLKKRNLDKDSLKKKLITFLHSRGYNYEVIRDAVNELIIVDDHFD